MCYMIYKLEGGEQYEKISHRSSFNIYSCTRRHWLCTDGHDGRWLPGAREAGTVPYCGQYMGHGMMGGGMMGGGMMG